MHHNAQQETMLQWFLKHHKLETRKREFPTDIKDADAWGGIPLGRMCLEISLKRLLLLKRSLAIQQDAPYPRQLSLLACWLFFLERLYDNFATWAICLEQSSRFCQHVIFNHTQGYVLSQSESASCRFTVPQTVSNKSWMPLFTWKSKGIGPGCWIGSNVRAMPGPTLLS